MDALNGVVRALPSLLAGVGTTLGLVAAAVGVGLALGIPIGIGHRYAGRTIRVLLGGFDSVFRGFPVIVLLFLFYFGLGACPGVRVPPVAAAVLALGLRSAAYQGQIFRGALGMIDRGQADAARALGFSLPRTILWILLPQALRFSIPSLGNEYAIVLKDSALAFIVGIVELTSRAKFMAARTRDPLTAYLAVAAIYWLLTFGGTTALAWAERRTRIPGFGARPRGRR